MAEFVLWFFAAYGVLSLALSIWHEVNAKRAWACIVFVSNPEKAEGELRSFLAELPNHSSPPHKIILIWQREENTLRYHLQREFPHVEVEEYVGDRTLSEVFQRDAHGKVIVLEC